MDEASRMLSKTDGFAAHKDVRSVLISDSDPSLVPLISIMIPTFRRPGLLRESLGSALAQTTSLPFEVVVIDNENEPEMSLEVDKVIASFEAANLRLFRNQTNLGMFGNWNRCIELARGEWLTIFNDDDLLKPNFIETVWRARQGKSMIAASVEHFGLITRSHPAIELLKPSYHYLRNALRFRNGSRRVVLSDVLRADPVQASLGVLFNKVVAVRLGGYNEACWPSADYIFTVRYWIEEDIIVLADEVAAYRWQENESFKTKTLEGWLYMDFLLRNVLIENFPASPRKSLLLYLSRTQAKVNAFLYRTRFNSEFDSAAALDKLGISTDEHFYLSTLARLMGVLWRLALINLDMQKLHDGIKSHGSH